MECFTRHTIDLLADVPELRTAKHILDIGGGTGQTARGLCAKNPPGKVTIFDSATVTTRAKEELAASGLDARVGTHVGDFFRDPFPTGVDTVLFAHVIEIYSEEQVKALLKKSFDVLPRGGRVVIWGTVANETETGGGIAAKISLYFLTLASGCGYCYPASSYERWLREIGFSKVSTQSGLSWEHGLIIAEK
jgi:cyclopropane fatty-acyl-phospholipid synthase-like methyltransferase